MKKLKTVLQSKWLYVILTIILVGIIICKTKIYKYQSVYKDEELSITGKVLDYSLDEAKISLTIKAKEKIVGNFYYKNINEITNIKIGSLITIKGQINTPNKNSIPNTFNYQKYLYNNKIYKTISIKSIETVINNQSGFEKIKNNFYENCRENAYLKLFIIGDKSSLDSNVYNNFKDIGVAHLLAVSGMHVSMLVSILSIFLKRLHDVKRMVMITLILLLYAYIVDFSPSILRVVIFYVINKTNKYFNLNLTDKQVLFFTAFFILLINPFYLYQVGFIYSFVTVYAIIISRKYFAKSYFKNIFIIGFWTLLFTLPITVNINYEINLITFLSNFILIPYVTFILYPISLLCFLFSKLIPILNLLSSIMEFIVFIISQIDLFVIVIPKMNYVFLIIYYFILHLVIYYNSYFYLIFLIIIICLNFLVYQLNSSYKIIFLDVGQADSSLLISPYQNNATLIDTGGIISHGNSSKYLLTNNTIIYLKSMGITKISNLIITHGDFDHMGEAINLVENFKVEKVIFNCGEFNELENELIKVLDKKKIPYYSCIKELNIDDNKLYFLNNKDYGNENDNSSVIYTELNNHKFLFMGDASVEVEEDLIEKYKLQNIDVLKVGHHGSKTSSGEEFIDSINPKYSIISVGKNNRYGHPNKDVLNNLDDSKVYRTDQDGSIMFKIEKNRMNIEICPP